MGPGIALTLSLAGLPATIVSRSAMGAERGLRSALRQLELLEENQLVSRQQVAFSRAQLASSSALEKEVAKADLIVESAPEDLAFKQQLFARLDALAPPTAVLASNTSGLSITAIAANCQRPERILTTHFWNPPHLMPLVEIVLGQATDPELAAAVKELLAAAGKTPVLVQKDTPGQLGNRLQMALVREAAHIVAEGIATAEEVDLAARMGFGLRLPMYGILEHQDLVGLDMALAIVDYVAKDLNAAPHAPPLLQQLVVQGDLGAKSGRGFHDWPPGKAEKVKARRDGFVLEVLRAKKSGRIG